MSIAWQYKPVGETYIAGAVVTAEKKWNGSSVRIDIKSLDDNAVDKILRKHTRAPYNLPSAFLRFLSTFPCTFLIRGDVSSTLLDGRDTFSTQYIRTMRDVLLKHREEN